MTLTQLSYVVAVAQHRHFGLAADASAVTQPTLSMQIQKLEDELGVIIFDRSQQPIRPTTIGEQIIAQAKVALAEADKIRDLTAIELNEVKGPLRLGVIPTLSPYLLPLFIQRFADSYPQAEVSVEELQTHEIVERLKNDRLDIGLLVTPLKIASVIEHPLFFEPFLLYVSPKHPLYQAKGVRERDLSSNEIWLLSEGHCFRDQVITLCGDRSSQMINKGNLHFESGNLETLKKMVDQSEGYTLLPLLAAQDIQDSAHKKQLKEFQAPVPTREVSLVHNALYRKRATVEALIACIRESVPPELHKIKANQQHRVKMPKID